METKTCEFSVEGMTCVSCSQTIQKSLKKNPGVLEANVHFTTNKATVTYDPRLVTEEDLLHSIHQTGYGAEPMGSGHHNHNGNSEEWPQFLRFLVAAILTLPLMLEMIGMLMGFEERIPHWIQLVLATVVQFYSGAQFYRNTYYALKAFSANMDTLIALGTSAAYFFSVVVVLFGLDEPLYFESSAMIITLILLGRWLESRSKRKASSAIQKLLNLQPKQAKVKRNGEFREVPVEEIVREDIFLVRPGESIAVDGEVVEGESAVDESTLTGESVPIYKDKGKNVFSGTLNTNGSLTVKATQVGSETVLSRMVQLVEQAQSSSAPIQKLADKISEIFVPIVLLVSAITFLLWIVLGYGVSVALINSVAVLVIACPCALGLATPTVIVVASGRAAEVGVLFKEASAIEMVQKMNVLIADKTGTLTYGRPVLQEIFPDEGHTRKEVLQIASSLAHLSSHPLSEAIENLAKEENLQFEPISEFNSYSGKGVGGRKRDTFYILGSARLAEEKNIEFDKEKIEHWQTLGKTVSLVWSEKELLGYLVIEDELRENSKRAIELIQKQNIDVIMLTGDSERTAKAVADKVNIVQYYAGVLPEDKVKRVQDVKNHNNIVGVVGDGVNDAPALATAHVGFAIDYGSDVAIEASDITLLGGDLMGVVKAIELSKATYRKIRENLFFAFIYNILGIPLAAFGLLNPIIAAAAMAASSLSVVGNALLLKKWTPKAS